MRLVTLLNSLLLVLILSGCAAQQAFRDGQHLYDSGRIKEGLAEIEKAYKLDPDNSEYRSLYFKLRDRAVFNWLSRAEEAINNAAWDEADAYYKNVLKIDPDNVRATIGLSSLKTAKQQAASLADAKSRMENDDLSGASRIVRQVLAESPSKPDAVKLKKAIDARTALRSQSEAVFKSKLDRSITLEFKDSPIKTIFDFISKVSGTNFLFDKEVRSDLRASIVVRDARIEDAIRFLLMSNQLEQRILNGNTLYIYSSTPQKIKEFQEIRVKNFYLANAKAKDVAAMLKSIVKAKDIYVDDKANLIVMRDSPDVIRVAERLVAAQDIAEPEAVLDVEVLEVGTSMLETLGLQYPSQLSFSVVGADKTPGTVSWQEVLNRNAGMVNATISNPALVLSMLHQDGDTNLLANPKIRAKNHEKANVHIGEKVPVITNTTTATGVVSQSITYLDVGLKLEVEPTIFLENDVGIKVGLEVSNITSTVQNTNGSLTYQLGTRSANTELRLKDGETQMLAGLINREDRKTGNSIPGLGQLPIIGRLFSSNTNNAKRTEVVLLITPHVVRNVVRPEAPIEEFSSGTASVISLDKFELDSAAPGKADAVISKDALHSVAASIVKPTVIPGSLPVSSVPFAFPKPGNAQSQSIGPIVVPDSLQAKSDVPAALQKPPAAQLSLDGPNSVPVGKDFSVQVNMSGGAGVRNIFLDFSFNPTQLQVVSVLEGDVGKGTMGKALFMQQVQDKIGRISLGWTGHENLPEKGVIATLFFHPLDSPLGKAELSVANASLSGESGTPIPIATLPVVTVGIVK